MTVVDYDKVGQGIAVGKVSTVDRTTRQFTGKMYSPGKAPVYDAQCVSDKWYFRSGKSTESFEAWAVVTYFKNLTHSKKLPMPVQHAIATRQIDWGKQDVSVNDDSHSDEK